MARTANVFARVEPGVKEQAEKVLDELGISMSNAVGMFLRQVVLQRGIPFEMKLPERAPLAYGSSGRNEKGLRSMSYRVEYTSEARQDLRNIYIYIVEKLMVPETAAEQVGLCMEVVISGSILRRT